MKPMLKLHVECYDTLSAITALLKQANSLCGTITFKAEHKHVIQQVRVAYLQAKNGADHERYVKEIYEGMT